MTSIRVGTEKVDSLINLVGELVITQSMLTQMGEQFEPARLTELLSGLEQLERNTFNFGNIQRLERVLVPDKFRLATRAREYVECNHVQTQSQ